MSIVLKSSRHGSTISNAQRKAARLAHAGRWKSALSTARAYGNTHQRQVKNLQPPQKKRSKRREDCDPHGTDNQERATNKAVVQGHSPGFADVISVGLILDFFQRHRQVPLHNPDATNSARYMNDGIRDKMIRFGGRFKEKKSSVPSVCPLCCVFSNVSSSTERHPSIISATK